ncbi:DPP IV N-terminal domain-containing protein [Chloroflexota bacterium]
MVLILVVISIFSFPQGVSTAIESSGKIAFISDRNGTQDIYVMDVDGTNVKQLTNDSAIETTPDWSPNGKEIAFASGPIDNRDIYVMDADGHNVRQLTENTDYNSSPAWSSNGKEIAFTSDRNGNREIYVMDADGTNVRRLTENLESDLMPAWSTGHGHSHSYPEPYTGPLFDSHLHTRNILPEYPGTLLSYLDTENVTWSVCFHTFPPPEVPSLMTIVESIEDRVVMLRGGNQFLRGTVTEAEMRQQLQPQGQLWGVGEIGLWHVEFQSVTFDSPHMETIFQMVDEAKGIVMIHFSGGREGERPTELTEIEPSIINYPDAIFLFHSINTFDVVAQLMSKYPNVYYSMDFGASFFKGRGVSLNRYTDAESFLAAVNETSLGYIVERNLEDLAPLIKQYPDRIFWGTDFSEAWHFEEPVTDLVTDISRRFIGQLPANIQEKYAYQNAHRVFGHFLSSNP